MFVVYLHHSIIPIHGKVERPIAQHISKSSQFIRFIAERKPIVEYIIRLGIWHLRLWLGDGHANRIAAYVEERLWYRRVWLLMLLLLLLLFVLLI